MRKPPGRSELDGGSWQPQLSADPTFVPYSVEGRGDDIVIGGQNTGTAWSLRKQ